MLKSFLFDNKINCIDDYDYHKICDEYNRDEIKIIFVLFFEDQRNKGNKRVKQLWKWWSIHLMPLIISLVLNIKAYLNGWS